MTRYRITAPVPRINDLIAGLRFVDSVAETDHEGMLSYFRRHKYLVEELASDGDVEVQLPDPTPDGTPPPTGLDGPKAPAKSASKEAWAAYALAQGVLPADIEGKTRDQLIELLTLDKTGDSL